MRQPATATLPFHLQQAAEKLAAAIRLMRGLLGNKSHEIELLVLGQSGKLEGLAHDDAWIDRLRPFFGLSQYATTFRYPTPSGKRKSGPPAAEINKTATTLRALVAEAQAELDV